MTSFKKGDPVKLPRPYFGHFYSNAMVLGESLAPGFLEVQADMSWSKRKHRLNVAEKDLRRDNQRTPATPG